VADLGDSSLVARKVGDMEHRLYASPKYLERRGTPATYQDLGSHACVLFRAKALERTWALRGPDGDVSLPVRGRIGGDDFTFVRAMIVAGAGIGLMPVLNCAGEERAGRIVRVLPEYSARGATLYVVYPSRKNVPAKVAAFRDFVVEAFGRLRSATL
jgi:DNA-binding transcriptional LysR family regulator